MKAEFDKATSEWFRTHLYYQTTVCRCDKCGLFYKVDLGHDCHCVTKERLNEGNRRHTKRNAEIY